MLDRESEECACVHAWVCVCYEATPPCLISYDIVTTIILDWVEL